MAEPLPPDRKLTCRDCGEQPHRYGPSPDSGPFWRCSSCGEITAPWRAGLNAPKEDRWYVIDTDGNIETFAAATEAEAYAEKLLDQERDRAWGSEWNPDTEQIEWGEMRCHRRAAVTHREPDPSGNTDELVDYGMVVIR